MIHYHGTPISGSTAVAIDALRGRHGMVSFSRPDQIGIVAEVCHSFCLDNGAFSEWKRGKPVNVPGYVAFVEEWRHHPGFDWCLIPDVVEGSEADNDALLDEWGLPGWMSVPVWHMHESLGRLDRLCHTYPRVALGSSGEWPDPGTKSWWDRMAQAMDAVCDDLGHPPAKLHGLRMLNPTIFSALPLSSADSTNVARSSGLDEHWKGPYTRNLGRRDRAYILASRIESHASASRWTGRDEQMNLELIG